ncbi:hypothetical protein H310_01935 [Aphanomyces invadans]|uniref:Uncharacterized protein n=1 Tax=Aphanomyces invadans TaxID=157072 RepID=A0A024UNL9_9STRA|nr:hypothetical protein H310_01935 [Aphanomyces invadans]ETW07412.1 hypothetical protein H310_01935 [Aphanomyces invadans]|eukprot:XP_008863505.1 hypothetical protein H310_01935 [Aphanomyces invadans]
MLLVTSSSLEVGVEYLRLLSMRALTTAMRRCRGVKSTSPPRSAREYSVWLEDCLILWILLRIDASSTACTRAGGGMTPPPRIARGSASSTSVCPNAAASARMFSPLAFVWLTLAPAAKRASTTIAWPWIDAMPSGELPSRVRPALASTPWSRRYCTTSMCPPTEATRSGVTTLNSNPSGGDDEAGAGIRSSTSVTSKFVSRHIVRIMSRLAPWTAELTN